MGFVVTKGGFQDLKNLAIERPIIALGTVHQPVFQLGRDAYFHFRGGHGSIHMGHYPTRNGYQNFHLKSNPSRGRYIPMTTNPPDMKVRLSAELRKQVEEAARENNRTLNSEIVSRLERSFSDISPLIQRDVPQGVEASALWKEVENLNAKVSSLQKLEREVQFLREKVSGLKGKAVKLENVRVVPTNTK